MIFMKLAQTKRAGGLSARLHFPEDERRLSWLPLLLDAYAIADTGVRIAVRNEEKKRKVRLACGKGCGNCCAQQRDIPLYPHELVGIYWYVSEKLAPTARDMLKIQLSTHFADSPCPFLADGSCAIHPLRPIGCRQFNVFAKTCAPGEDPYYTRRDDVLVPINDYTDRSFAAVLPFYNMKRQDGLAASVKLVRAQIMNLQTYDWKKLAMIIENAGPRLSE